MTLRVPRDLKYGRERKLHVLMTIIKCYVKRVGDGKGRTVGNEIYVYSDLGSEGEDM